VRPGFGRKDVGTKNLKALSRLVPEVRHGREKREHSRGFVGLDARSLERRISLSMSGWNAKKDFEKDSQRKRQGNSQALMEVSKAL